MSDDIRNRHGAFSWAELMTPNPEGAKSFYSSLLGWELQDFPMENFAYTVVKTGGEQIGGIMPLPPGAPAHMPPSWGCYITVDDVDAIAEKAFSLGANVLVPPQDIPSVGRFAVLQDPQGAMFNIITYLEKF